jgi:hypothetical protein
MSTKRFSQQTSPKLALAAPIVPLGQSDLRFVQLALRELAPAWTADLVGICAFEATLVVVPFDGDDVIGPSFLISRETCGFRLDQVHWDMMAEVGAYESLSDVVSALLVRLLSSSERGTPALATVH